MGRARGTQKRGEKFIQKFKQKPEEMRLLDLQAMNM